MVDVSVDVEWELAELRGQVRRLEAEVVRLTGLLGVVVGGDVVCVVCGRVFGRRSVRGPVPRFCSAACRQRAHRARNAMRPPGGV